MENLLCINRKNGSDVCSQALYVSTVLLKWLAFRGKKQSKTNKQSRGRSNFLIYALSVVTFLLFFFLLFFVCLLASCFAFSKPSIFSSSCFYPQMRIPMLFSRFVCCLQWSQFNGWLFFLSRRSVSV